jgi:hypothetical protein
MFAVWTNSTTTEQEAAVFNIDEPIDFGRPMPLLLATPSGCILDVVLDPATAIALSEGLPQGECPRA